jgi:exodeoxyribonuclease V beta subunit
MEYIPVTNPEKIDLHRHAIVEASAGTGKTYTIENLVVRMLVEREDVRLENILLVTFTEKATCELKIRIREKLENEMEALRKNGDKEKVEKLLEALDSFDSAPIHTIHGFCQTILKDHAFENRTQFEWELVDDNALFESLLKEQIRKTWPAEFGGHLTEILELSGFSKKKERFENSVTRAALSFDPEAGDRIFPEIDTENLSQAAEKISSMRKKVLELKMLADGGKFIAGFEKLNDKKIHKNKLTERIVQPLSQFIDEMDPEKFRLSSLVEILEFVKEKGNDYLTPQPLKNDKPNPEVCPHWGVVCQALVDLLELYEGARYMLAAGSILRLKDDARKEKAKKGLISFDDMLGNVRRALFSPDGEKVAEILRKKYRVAFVDEFQDTDPIQWQIFKKVFLEKSEGEFENTLFVIGDPKQAIYGFRGADVHAYLGAKKEMEELSRKGLANCYSLAVNWRSVPELIEVFNHLFSASNWFAKPDDPDVFKISYLPVDAPEEDKRIFTMERDDSRRGALNIMNVCDAPKLKNAKPVLARFIAEEIEHLVGSGSISYRHKDGDSVELSYSDICILVRGKNETPFLEEELRRRAIPYSYYKKAGLYSSEEAYYLGLLFHAILDPSDLSSLRKSLLTPFFDLEPEQLHRVESLSQDHPIKRLLSTWMQFSTFRRWGRLFQSIMEDSGFVYRESTSQDWERKYANYRQMFDHLQDIAYRGNLDLRGMTAVLDGYRKGTFAAEEGADLHQIETEDKKVQIMTMHVAKGLEFPVVFAYGGLTQPGGGGDDYCVFHEVPQDAEGNGTAPCKVFDLSKSIGKDKEREENREEDKRLFYVALTRARIKLYAPFYEYDKNYFFVGPVSRLVTPALREAFISGPPEELEENRAFAPLDPEYVTWHTVKFLASPQNQPSAPDVVMKPEPQVKGLETKPADSILPVPRFPETSDFRNRHIELASFSSIHNMIASQAPSPEIPTLAFSAIAQKAKEDDEVAVSPPAALAEGAGEGPDDIPGGTDTGSMFHDILENISFETVCKAPEREEAKPNPLLANTEIRGLIENKMDLYAVDRQWRNLVADVVYNTLKSPVVHLSQDFVLADLKDQDRLHEPEFYFPHSLPFNREIEGCATCDGFIRGFVDLIFTFEDKFYVADWKSNIVPEGYFREALQKSMDRAGYHLQYKIYTIATLRWLSDSLGDQFDPRRDFGGVFYFYLRGMGGESGEGIYYVPASDLGDLGSLDNNYFITRHPRSIINPLKGILGGDGRVLLS